jgi:ElaB/YqjD/DUF883 family membrane-anchored ribosome-binding protein
MNKRETAKSLASASSELRVSQIEKAADQIVAQTRAEKETLTQLLQPIAKSLGSLSTDTKETLDSILKTTSELPQAYLKKITEATQAAEKSATSLLRVSLDVQNKATQVAEYARQVDKYHRRQVWLGVGITAMVAAIPPSVLCLAFAAATGYPPSVLLKALWAL